MNLSMLENKIRVVVQAVVFIGSVHWYGGDTGA